MSASYFRNFTAAVVCSALVAGCFVPTTGYADSWEDAFTQEELDILFGKSGEIPSRIGPHRVVMSMEEAKQVEGEIPPIYLIGLGSAFFAGALGGASVAYFAGEQNLAYGAFVGGVGGGAAFLGGPWGAYTGAAGSAAAAAACLACHQAK